MLLPADRLLAALTAEFNRLAPRIADKDTDGSAAQAISNAILLLRNRETGGAEFVQAQLARLAATLRDIAGILNGAERPELQSLQAAIAGAEKSADVGVLETMWRDILASAQRFASDIAADANVSADQKQAVLAALVAWEAKDRQSQVAPTAAADGDTAVSIDADNLTAYLRDRFAEPGLEIIALTPLAGGFGKETVLFDVAGKALAGSFVMRRDLAGEASLTNDCHRIKMESPVIEAAHARGFPAPEVVWLDTEHRLLPGGDFIVMRKSPGKIGGNFFGATTAIPDDLVDSLAEIMARLHALPPLVELGDLNDAIRAELWDKTREESIRDYIAGWRDFFLASNHSASPSMMALFGWLLDHVPPRQGRPVLLHGDFGFHNFLFDDGKLTAVLDWEFAHVGDPAEELGYVRETVGKAIDWDRLVANYVAAGGDPVDDQTMHYFRVWAHVRNAAASNIFAANFIAGMTDELKLAFLPYIHFPMFISAAQALIEEA